MRKTVYYINDWSNSRVDKFGLFSIKNSMENAVKPIPSLLWNANPVIVERTINDEMA
jgi:hypothetical protein